MGLEIDKNPDADFVLHGRKTPIRVKENENLSNSEKTISSRNLSSLMNFNSMNPNPDKTVPGIDDLERSINELKLDLEELNASLHSSNNRSQVFLGRDLISPVEDHLNDHFDDDPELTSLLRRHDPESVSHLPGTDTQWYSNPKHLTKPLGDYPQMHELGVTRRSVSPVNRTVGRFGAEIATKDITGDLNSSIDLSASGTFPVKLTAPHIVGVHSLLPPKYPVRHQDRSKSKTPQARSVEFTSSHVYMKSPKLRSKSCTPPQHRSPLPVWMPTSKHANASAQSPPKFSDTSRKRRPASASHLKPYEKTNLSASLPLPKRSISTAREPYRRPTVQPEPGYLELSFLRSADEIDTRRSLVENSPYQQHLAKLRLERLRVEEAYMLQLRREAELERIRGPKPKWYESAGPEFHYECNKNTTLHKTREHWGETMRYRNHLLDASNEFSSNLKAAVPPLS